MRDSNQLIGFQDIATKNKISLLSDTAQFFSLALPGENLRMGLKIPVSMEIYQIPNTVDYFPQTLALKRLFEISDILIC